MKAKNIFLPLLLSAIALISLSCEKEIEIELPEFESKVVIEATITSLPGPYFVKLSYTQPYLSQAGNPPATGARVIIRDDAGQVDTLSEISPGMYQTSTLSGIIGRTYFLEVQLEGETYTAQSLMPRVNPIDSISLTYYPEPRFFLDSGWYATFNAQEAPGIGDFYRFKFIVNDSLYDGIGDLFFSDDRVVDGNYAQFEFPYHIHSGDTLRMEILSLTNTAYDYYLTMQQLITSGGNPFGAPPDNVVSNIEGGAMGFFMVSGAAASTVVVPQN